jgi:hypothetical protein
MDTTHGLIFQIVPSCNYMKSTFQQLLIRSSDPANSIKMFLDQADPTVKTLLRLYEEDLKSSANIEELTDFGNLVRGVTSWLYEIREALQEEHRIKMISKAVTPMSWLNALIKTLEMRELIR